MRKLTTYLKGLKKSQEILGHLDEFGIDVDRLIAISNAQGPQAKIIKSVLSQASGLIEFDESVGESTPKTRPKALKPKRRSKKTTSS